MTKTGIWSPRAAKLDEAVIERGRVDHNLLYEPIPQPFTVPGFKLSVDSGAHTLYKKFFVQGAATRYARLNADYSYLDSLEFKRFLEAYITSLHANKHLYEFYVTLDIINNPEKSWEITEYMESCGLSPIPVFHNGEDIKWLHKMLDRYDYFGISGLGQDITKPKFKTFGDPCFAAVCDSHGTPRAKVHGFAMGTPDLLAQYPWYSADQSTWTYMSRVGSLLVPRPIIRRGNIIDFDYTQRYRVFPVTRRRRFENGHVTHLKVGETQKWLLAYLEKEGFRLEEAQNYYHVRDILNIRLFLNVERAMKACYTERFGYGQGGNILFAGTPAGASTNRSRNCRLLYDLQASDIHWLGTPVYPPQLANLQQFKISSVAGEDFRVHWNMQNARLQRNPVSIPKPQPRPIRRVTPQPFVVKLCIETTVTALDPQTAMDAAVVSFNDLGLHATPLSASPIQPKIAKRPLKPFKANSFNDYL